MQDGGNCLRLLRKQHKLTQAELAEALGIAERTIIRWEKGYVVIPRPALKILADFFKVAPTDLAPDLAQIPSVSDIDAIPVAVEKN